MKVLMLLILVLLSQQTTCPWNPPKVPNKRMRSSSPATTLLRDHGHVPRNVIVSRSRSPTGKPEQAVKEKMAEFGHRLAASIGKAAEATASAASPPAEVQSRG